MSEPRKVGAELRGHSYGLDTLAEIAEAEGWPEDSMGRLEAGMECLRDARKERDDCRAALAAARDALDEIRSLLHEWTYHYKDRSVVLAHNVAAEAIGRPDRIAEGQKRAGLTAERDAALARAERAEAAVLELWDRTLFGQSEMPEIEALVAEIRARGVKP